MTANQVTIVRLMLLPLGTALLYADRTGQWIALVAMTMVGCTDFVDGWLARKHGPTVLGALMDPIADKMFVALTMLPALDLGWLPWSIVALIFLREFVITAARTAYSRREVTLKTSYLAKVKTWYQMMVMGMIFLLEIAHTGARFVLGAGAFGAIVGGLVYYAVKRRPWRGSVAFAISFGAVFGVSLTVSDPVLAQILGWLTVGITWASGGAYLYGIRDLPGTARFDAHDAVRLFGAVALPMLACPLIWLHHADSVRAAATGTSAGWYAWPLFVTMAMEFAIGGLDNLLAHNKRLGRWWTWGTRVGLQAIFLGAALVVVLSGGSRPLVYALTLGAATVTLISAAVLFAINRRVWLDADRGTSTAAA